MVAYLIEFVGHHSPVSVPLLPLLMKDMAFGCCNEGAFRGVVIAQVNVGVCIEGAEAE